MAGAGFKTFNTGDVLTASDVNTYLMQQTVMVFASSAARTTALGANVAEGMLSYLKDTDQVEVYNGTSWVASDDPNAIQNTIVDAKGDIITATAADTPARLAVGSNGYTLVADSSTSTGLAYAGTTNGNPVINGGFDIWQRGTSISVTSATATYTADRWNAYSNGNALTVSRQSVSDSTNLPNIQFCARVQRNSGQTSTNGVQFVQSFETAMSIPYAGRTVTVSFYARAGANFSAASNALKFYLLQGTGTDQLRQTSAYTGESDAISNQTATLTTTWQRFSFTGSIASTATEFTTYFSYTPSGTAGANDYYEITGVQIDLGSTALPFRRSGGTIQGELAACQRYYQRLTGNTSNSVYFATGVAISTTRLFANYQSPVAFRSAPSVAHSSGKVGNGVISNQSITSISNYANAGLSQITIDTNVASGLTSSGAFMLVCDQNAYIELSSEL